MVEENQPEREAAEQVQTQIAFAGAQAASASFAAGYPGRAATE